MHQERMAHPNRIKGFKQEISEANLVKSNNFDVTEKITNFCTENKIKLIYPSTTSVYGSQQETVDEFCSKDELKPQSPYAETKIKEEEYIQEKCEHNNLEAIISQASSNIAYTFSNPISPP